jgi:transformation/transcription domain-associated protein
MGFLRRSHPFLATEVEAMLEEVIVRFRPDPAEELLSAVYALLTKCFQPALQEPTSLPPKLRSTLGRICVKFFSGTTKVQSAKHSAFRQKYQAAFERDFKIPEDGDSPTLSQVILRLKRWKHALMARVKLMPAELYMEKCSRHLLEFPSSGLEIPGQYSMTTTAFDCEPDISAHVRLVRFGAEVDVLHRHGSAQRRLSLQGDDGRKWRFVVQFAIPHLTRTDERMAQLHTLLHHIMSKARQTRPNNMILEASVVVPITPRVRLLSDREALTSLGEG